ncbi:MAG: hypothetical protein QW403_01015, partial [Candidatus Aenigmatarchaeota archaeon]
MSIDEKEKAIRSFKFYLGLVNTDFGVDLDQINEVRLQLSQLVGYFPFLRNTEEYKEINYIFEDLKSPVTRFFSGKSKVEDLIKYGSDLLAKAYEELARLKAQKPPEIKREVVTMTIPPSPWYKVASIADELSDAMWEDDFKIRNILPIFERLISELEKSGDPENFCEELKDFYRQLSDGKLGSLTIPELRKLNPSYIPRDEELRTLITRIKKYA